MANSERPVARSYNNARAYFDRSKPLCFEESYIYYQDDILTVMPDRDTTWLDDLIEEVIGKFQCKLMKVIHLPSTPFTIPKKLTLVQYIFSPKVSFQAQTHYDTPLPSIIKQSMREKADPSTGIVMYSRSRIKIVVTLIVLTIITALLVVPVYVLWDLTREKQSKSSISVIIVVLLLFTLVFSSILLKFTRAKRHEILAAAAA